MKRKLILAALLSIISLICFSQEYFPEKYFTVVARSGLKIRQQPGRNSQILTTIPFGTEVDVDFSKGISDEIDGFTGTWYPVSFNGHDGYAWSQYLGNIAVPKQESINNDFRIIEEGAHCGQLNFMPDLYWYGVYETGKTGVQELKKAEITLIIKSTLKDADKELYFGDPFTNADFLIKTGSDRKSVFLVGSKEPLNEIQFNGKGFDEIGSDGFLYPEQKESVFIPGYEELEIKAKEAVSIVDTSNCTIERKYELELSAYRVKQSNKTFQNITKDIPYTGFSASRHAGSMVPRIIWCGDIDHDHKFDLLIYSDQMRESGDDVGYLVLFLSSRAGTDNIVKKVAEWAYGSCEG